MLLSAVLLWGGAAPAREAGGAEPAIRRGIELRRQGDDEQALREFKEAYDESQSPRALAQMGLAEHALGRWVDAEAHLQAALEVTSDPWIQKNRPALRSSLEAIAKHLGSLEVRGEPAGAEVRIQGASAGKLPMDKAVRVAAGDVIVEVRHPGYRTIARTVTVGAGEMARETIVLVPFAPEPGPPPAASPQAARLPAPTAGDSAPAPVPTLVKEPPPEPSGVTGKWWFWAAIGAAVTGGVVGAFLLTRDRGGSPGCPSGFECPQ